MRPGRAPQRLLEQGEGHPRGESRREAVFLLLWLAAPILVYVLLRGRPDAARAYFLALLVLAGVAAVQWLVPAWRRLGVLLASALVVGAAAAAVVAWLAPAASIASGVPLVVEASIGGLLVGWIPGGVLLHAQAPRPGA